MASDKAFWAEFFPVNPATGLTVRIRICTSNTPEATGIDLGNGEWMPYMSSFPDTEISVFSGTFDGVSESSISNVEAGDINGFAMLFPSYVWDGAEVRVYKGAEGSTTLGQLTRIFTGVTTETPSNEEGEVKWSIRDKSYLFDVEILKTTYAGTTGYEGTAEMKGVSKPFALGEVLNLEPFLVDPAYLIYQYHGYGRTIGVQGLYENGLGFGAGLTPVAWAGNVAATYAALKAVTLAAGQWVDCPSIGMFRLGGEPLQGGVITCDVKGQERSAGVLCERIDHVLEYLVGLSNVPAAMIDGSSYSNVYANSNSQTIGDYFTSPVNLGEVMAKYLGDAGCYYFVSTGGLLRMGAVRMSTPALEIRSDGTTSPTTETISSLPVSAPYKRIRMGADKVFRVHSLDEISDALYQAVHTLQTQLTDITEDFYLAVDDDNLTIQEKIQTAIPTNTQYGNQYIELRARALALGLSVTTIDAAYTAYTTDRNAISPAWNDTTQNSTGIPATFRANVAALGSALVALSVDISEEDAKRANWGTVASRPTELTDGRIAIGIRSTGAIQGTIWGGANTVPIVDLLESGLFGKSLSIDPDFSKGVKPSNFGMYGDGGNGDITSAVINDATAPNGSGKILRVTYDGTGTPGVDPNPGFGGIVQVLSNAGSGMSRPTFYSPNTKVAFIVRAKIPAGRYLEHASNVTGTGGSWTWLTDNAGTGAWQTYIGIRYIGATGILSTTGHFWISGGANSAFSWDIAVYEQREIASAALPQLNRLIDTVGAMRDDGELITIQGTSASIVGQGYMATQNFADWKTRVSGVGKPSNNAGSSNNLTAIGVGITITGNTVFKNSPGVHGSYDGGAVGVAQKGACFISSGCTYDSNNGGGWRTSLCLDQTNTTSTNGGSTAGNFIAEYTAGNPSSYLDILRHNGSGYVSIGTYTVPGATYSTRRMALATNGLRAFVMIDGVVYGGNTSSFNVAPNTTFWPKVLNYHQDALSEGSTDGIVDVQYGEWTDVRTYLDDGYTILNQAGFKTDEGTASGIIGQGALATKNNVDLSTTQVLPRGSIPSSLANNGFTYTSTVSTITINWPTMTVYRSDGSTISISSGSQAITGLGSGTTYRVYPYVEDNGGSSGTITFVTAVGTVFGSPQILYSNSSPNVAAAAAMYFYSRIPMGNFAVATTTSGGGGGGGGGWNCLHESMIVAGKLAHDLEPGDVVLTPEGPTPILQVEHHTCSKWYELYSGEQLVGKFTEKHLLYHARTGEAVMAANVRLGDILKAIGQHYEITGLRLCNETAIAVGILIEDPHLHFAGESGVLCHNGIVKF